MRMLIGVMTFLGVLGVACSCGKGGAGSGGGGSGGGSGGTGGSGSGAAADTSFSNPLLSSGPDPWVIQQDTMYYYMNTLGDHLAIWTTSKMSNLGKVIPVTIWN